MTGMTLGGTPIVHGRRGRRTTRKIGPRARNRKAQPAAPPPTKRAPAHVDKPLRILHRAGCDRTTQPTQAARPHPDTRQLVTVYACPRCKGSDLADRLRRGDNHHDAATP